ncbi:unnamed protein product, partial [Discosporangium mesarthrocarpum]
MVMGRTGSRSRIRRRSGSSSSSRSGRSSRRRRRKRKRKRRRIKRTDDEAGEERKKMRLTEVAQTSLVCVTFSSNYLTVRPYCAYPRPRKCQVHMVDELSRAGAAVAVSDGEEKFESWAWMMGISAPKLRHAVFSDPVQGNLRGLQTREATAASETLVTLPKDVAITLMAGEASPFKSWVSPEFWDGQPWYVKLGLKLLWERQLGGASKVKGYVDLLPSPESFETLVHWSDEELAELMYAPCIGSAKRQRLKWDKIHQELVSKCPNGSGRVVSRDDLVWAMECVLSRAFGGRFGGGTEALLAGGAAAAAGVGSYLATGEAWGVALAALALLPLTMREISALSGL